MALKLVAHPEDCTLTWQNTALKSVSNIRGPWRKAPHAQCTLECLFVGVGRNAHCGVVYLFSSASW